MGLKVFPDFNDCWHFDDKIAETYFLETLQAPIPRSYMFYDYASYQNFIDHESPFPIVAKLRCGSGSHNVKMIKNKSQALRYGRRMLKGGGFNPAPSLFYKTNSNIQSVKTRKDFFTRLKRVPEFLGTLMAAREFPVEKRYVFMQEYISNDGYDLKVVTVGNKLSFIARNVRRGDFRASDGGDCYWDKSLIPENVLKSAFATSEAAKFQCMGYDYVVEKESKKGYIVEMSCVFSHNTLLGAGGYYDRKLQWHDEPLNAPEEVLMNLLNE